MADISSDGRTFGYLAHSANRAGQVDLLDHHLVAVAARAASYAAPFGCEEEARVAGLLHDIGKYGDLFQRRLQGLERGVDHWSAGAWEALSRYHHSGIAAALAIQGHHIGIQWASKHQLSELEPERLRARTQGLRPSGPQAQILRRLEADDIDLKSPALVSSKYDGFDSACSGMLDVRLLFSTLVDADFVETAAHFDELKQAECPPPLNADHALALLNAYVRRLSGRAGTSQGMTGVRSHLYETALAAGQQSSGLFTLTAPTGAGKTVSMLAFALAHALRHGLRRIVVVLPYLTIIEQTSRTYRDVFADVMCADDLARYIVEDHSLAGVRRTSEPDAGESFDPAELSLIEGVESPRWDAPIVITTSVQFLESLFSNKPGACRKLHNLARSVVLFDEVQTLPVGLTVPTLAALSRLSMAYGSSVVFSSATQPAYSHLSDHVRQWSGMSWAPTEIVPDTGALFAATTGRYRVDWSCLDERTTWKSLADDLRQHHSVLCIVNLKRHATALFKTLQDAKADGALHLSTNMCPRHRNDVLYEVHRRLDNGEPCRLVATQCVEAGVDLDFPCVFRALGPLDSVAQAAGRCNRSASHASGLVRVFVPEDVGYPDTAYSRATSVALAIVRDSGPDGPDLGDPRTYDRYYRTLYDLSQPEQSRRQLLDAIRRQDFPEVARLYRLISTDAVNVVVPYDMTVFRRLRDEAMHHDVGRAWIRMARQHSVSLFRPRSEDPVYSHLNCVNLAGRGASDDWYVWDMDDGYDRWLGLTLPSSSRCLIA